MVVRELFDMMYLNEVETRIGGTLMFTNGCSLFHEIAIIGFSVSYFCFHEWLSIIGVCRVCFFSITGRGIRITCNYWTSFIEAIDYMKEIEGLCIKLVKRFILLILTMMHSLDCFVCDQGGECDLQDLMCLNSLLSSVRKKKKKLSKSLLFWVDCFTIITRCIWCLRCIRIMEEVLKKWFIGLVFRGIKWQLAWYKSKSTKKENSIFTEICPVGALLRKKLRWFIRFWELEIKRSNFSNNNGIRWKIICEKWKRRWFKFSCLIEKNKSGLMVLPVKWFNKIKHVRKEFFRYIKKRKYWFETKKETIEEIKTESMYSKIDSNCLFFLKKGKEKIKWFSNFFIRNLLLKNEISSFLFSHVCEYLSKAKIKECLVSLN